MQTLWGLAKHWRRVIGALVDLLPAVENEETVDGRDVGEIAQVF